MDILELIKLKFVRALKFIRIRTVVAFAIIIVSLTVLVNAAFNYLNPVSEILAPISIGTAYGLLLCGIGLFALNQFKKIVFLVGICLIILGTLQVSLSFNFFFPELGISIHFLESIWTEQFIALMFIFFGIIFSLSNIQYLRQAHFGEALTMSIIGLSILALIESSPYGFFVHVEYLPLFYVNSTTDVWFILAICATLLPALYDQHKLKQKNWILIVLSATTFLAITVSSVIFVENVFDNQIESEFRKEVTNATKLIQKRLTIYENTLESGVGYFVASEDVQRDQWRRYVDSLDIQENYPGIQGIGYSVFVTPQERDDHVASIRDQGFPQFDIKPEGKRDIYTSIIYLEPFDIRNRQAFGFDMFQETNRRNAMERARDENKPILSGLITLVQEIDDDVQKGFLMYVPHYSIAAPRTIQQRRESIIGYVYSPFRARDFVEGVIGSRGLSDISLMIYDGDKSTQENLLYNDIEKKKFDEGVPRYSIAEQINANGRIWTLEYSSSPLFGISFTSKIVPLLLFLSGTVFSLLLFISVNTLLNSRQRAQEIAEVMTESFRRQQRRLESFHEIVTMPQIGLHERINQTLKTVTQALDLDTGIVSHISNDTYTIAFISSKQANIAQGDQFKLEQTICDFTYKQNKLHYFSDPEQAPMEKRELLSEINTSAYIGIPITTNGQRYGTVGFFGKDKRSKFTEDDRVFVTLAANWIARLIENDQVDNAKNDFLTLASHQLRTPLSIVNWYSELLQNKKFGELNEKQQKYLREISLGNHRMIKQVNELLNASRLDMGSFMVDPVEISLEKTLSEVLSQYKDIIQDKEITYTQEIDPGADTIICDQSIVNLLLDNLLSNATKYTPEKGSVRCIIRNQDNNYISLEIIDSGMGIPQEEAKKIFSKMYRASNVKEKDTDGTGLGLYMVKKALNAIGGKISFSSVQNVGTTFTAILPKESKKRDGTSRLVSQSPKK